MRLSTAASIGLFVISAAACAYSVTVVNNNLDTGVPSITQDSDKIEISIKDDESAILQGITAVDSKDGDVTASLVVESLSNFIDKGVRKANIVAFDSDNHIARISREVTYSDYTRPRFELEEPLICTGEYIYGFAGTLQAIDCIDGNISNKIHFSFNEEYSKDDTEVKVLYSVSNSVGDTINLPVTVTRQDQSGYGQPDIRLKDYLIYVKDGEKVDPMEHLYQITMGGKTYKLKSGKMTQTGSIPANQDPDVLDSERLKIEVGEPDQGVYEISYTAIDYKDEEDATDDQQTTMRLIVVTEE